MNTLINWFKNLIHKPRWALVKTYKVDRTNYPYATYHVHLFESDRGIRRAEYLMDGDKYDIDRKNSWLRQQDVYQLTIYRWLQGRYDPAIARYSDVGEEDLVNALKGKVQ